jgi:oligopeptide/dipeptide ABC transporter ATP-binding protein
VAGAGGLLARPLHPYTRAMLAAVPRLRGPRRARLAAIPGAVPVLRESPSGCRFAARCPQAADDCAEPPPSRETLGGHVYLCHRLAGEEPDDH